VIENSQLRNVNIFDNSIIKNCKLMNCYINNNSIIENSFIGGGSTVMTGQMNGGIFREGKMTSDAKFKGVEIIEFKKII